MEYINIIPNIDREFYTLEVECDDVITSSILRHEFKNEFLISKIVKVENSNRNFIQLNIISRAKPFTETFKKVINSLGKALWHGNKAVSLRIPLNTVLDKSINDILNIIVDHIRRDS